jgi:hypothetical protein
VAVTVLPPPSIACARLIGQWDRMAVEGVPEKIDMRYLDDLAGGTQYLYRQTYRSLGLTTADDRPTPLLHKLADADQADRPQLFGEILSERYPDLTGLSLDATWDDFFRVLRDHYDVASEMQQRKTLTFFVHAADYVGLEISPGLRPAKRGPGSRKPKAIRPADPPTSLPALQPAKTDVRTPAVRASHSGQGAKGGADVRDVSFGNAGSVSIIVNINWLDLPDDKFTELRKLIKDIQALGESGS